MKKKKDLSKLVPIIKEKQGDNLSKEEIMQMSMSFENSKIVVQDDKDKNIFTSIVRDMNDPKNISMKTEYLSIQENFAGVKLDFLAKFANIPMLENFVETFETKRVSLHRKGRQEDVMILQERRAEEQRNKMEDFAKMFNVT